MKRPKLPMAGTPIDAPAHPGHVMLLCGKWFVIMPHAEAVDRCLTGLFDFYGELNSRPRHGRLMR